MKKRIMFVMAMLVLSLFITGFKSSAAEATDYYAVVRDGVYNDIQFMEEDEEITVKTVDFKECVSEKTCTYDVKFTVEGELYRLWVYLDKYQDECTAILYRGDEVDEVVHKSLTAVAQEDYM